MTKHCTSSTVNTRQSQVRQRGVIKCVPRFLGWLRQARITLFHPSRPEVREEMEVGMAEVMEDIVGLGPMASA